MSLAQLTALTSPLNAEQIQTLQQLAQTLTPQQLAWVSGYLAGIGQQGVLDAPVAVPQNADKLTIVYGSQTGTARSVAEQLGADATAKGIANEIISMGDFKPKQLKSLTHLAILVSTHGEGDPPDDAEELHAFLSSKKAPKLDSLQFSVLAFGDSSYEFFCKTGEDFEQKLSALGAKKIVDTVKLDVDYEAEATTWNESLLTTVEPLLQSASANVVAMPGVSLQQAPSQYNRKNPYAATLLTNQKITGRDSGKNIRHFEFDLGDSGISYEPGDALGVWFSNDSALVSEILELISVAGDSSVDVQGESVAITDALANQLELTLLHPGFVQKYAELAGNEELSAIAADKDKLRAYIDVRQVADVVRQFPAAVDAQAFVSCLRGLTPRMYSIASSMADVEDEVHLTIAVVSYETDGQQRLGGASGFLGDRAEEGAEVRIFVEANSNFKLPTDSNKPVIMIGPGTGIAPFRSFVQEREATGAEGKNWLFFGNPHSTQDFLYQTEWQRYIADGVLTDIDLAFSRDQASKVYVQHRLLEQAEKVWQWIEDGAYVYVCGDATHMAKDVHNALLEIIQKQGNKSADDAEALLTQLRRDKRYQKDVY